MWNPNQNSYIYVNQSDGSTGYVDSGFYGFLQPRYLNGTFGYQDAMLCSPMFSFDSCYLVPTGHEVRFFLEWVEIDSDDPECRYHWKLVETNSSQLYTISYCVLYICLLIHSLILDV
jgi:hypothetical protein